MYRYLISCRDQLHAQLLHTQPLPRSTELVRVLANLNATEKLYLRNIFLNTPWNRGSTQVLSVLQRADILTMSEYIYHQYNVPHNDEVTDSFMCDFDSEEINRKRAESVRESVQLMLNDVLESEFILLADLVGNVQCTHAVGLKITDTIKECFRRLVVDISDNPTLVQRNYLHELSAWVSGEQMEHVRLLHWSVFEELEECSVLEAISSQAKWNAQFQNESSSSLTAIMLNISTDIPKFIKFLMNLVENPNLFTGWRWWLHFWGLLMSQEALDDQIFSSIRQHLKDMFRQFHATKSDAIFFAMMLCARQTCNFAPENRFENYAKWYKKSIGEMQYGQSKDEFRRAMQTLTKMIKYEADVGVLEMHARTAISAPAFCSDLVLSFKQISKSWLHDLKEGRGREHVIEGEDVQCVVIV